MKRTLLLALIAFFILLQGCAKYYQTMSDVKRTVNSFLDFSSEEDLTSQEYVWAGMDAYEEGDYKDAIENFQKLKDYYPFSKYAILAELKLGDSHYHLQQYEDAIFAYEEFEKLHPRNEAIPYVIYQIGLCYFEQIDTIDRDQTNAREALETFQRLQKQFPGNEYSHTAEAHIAESMKSLSGHEYVIGVFYYNTDHYEAALNRFMRVISKYPDVGYHQDSLEYIAKCEASLAEEEED